MEHKLNLQKKREYRLDLNCVVYDNFVAQKCRKCGKDLSDLTILYKGMHFSKICPDCNLYYIPFDIYIKKQLEFRCLNLNEVDSIERKRQREAKLKEISKQSERLSTIKSKKQQEKIKRSIRDTNRQKLYNNNLARIEENNRKLNQGIINEPASSVKRTIPRQSSVGKIELRSFVIHSNTFLCMNKNHRMKDIDAYINVIDKNGLIQNEVVAAGYCESCDVYCILESAYKSLLSKGTPICQVMDYKLYSKVASEGKMNLAPKSILTLSGYSVAQTSGLTGKQRQKILSNLMDNNIVTKNEILSYFKFFVNQHKNDKRYKKAVEKWKADEEFVLQYKLGEHKSFIVKDIY